MSSHIVLVDTSIPPAVLHQIATAGPLDEISNVVDAVRSHIFFGMAIIMQSLASFSAQWYLSSTRQADTAHKTGFASVLFIGVFILR